MSNGPKDGLKPEHEKFVENVVKGMNYTNAYKDAFPKTIMSDKNIASRASHMVNGTGDFKPPKDKVRTRLLKLRGKALKLKNKKDMTQILSIVKVLTTIATIMLDPNASNRDRLRAAELAGKYLGLFNERIQISGDLPPVIKNDVTY